MVMPMLKDGRYEIPEKWNTATNGRWVIGKDKSTGKNVFIKEFMNYRYPQNIDGKPELLRVEKRAQKFHEQMKKINDEVRRIAGSGGDVVVTTDFFREGLCQYKVTDCVDKVEWSEDRSKYTSMMSVEQVDDMMLRIVFAMSALHNAKLLHCDLKPENVFIVKKESRYVGMVSDFDDSFFIDKDENIPNGADVIGTPEYMSPELALHKFTEEDEPPLPLTAASDLFALGLMYHEYLTGEMPSFNSDDYGGLWEVMMADEEESGGYKISEKLDISHRILIERLLQPNADDRLPSCAALAKGIKDIKLRRNREYKITVLNGGSALNGKEVSVYAKYSVGAGEYKHDVTDKVITAKTGRDGSLLLKGLPADATYQLVYGKDKKDIAFQESGDNYAATVQIGTTAPPPAPTEYVISVTCDGKTAANVSVRLGRSEGGKEKMLPVKKSDAKGRIVFPKKQLPEGGSYWVECEGIRKAIKWDKNLKCSVALTTHRVKVLRDGKPYKTTVEMLAGSGTGRRRVAAGSTDAAGMFIFRIPQITQPWTAICDGKEMEVVWNAKWECELKIISGVKLTLNAYIHGSDPRKPVAGARMVVAQKLDGKMKTIVALNTGADGKVEMGSFPEGEYYIGVVAAPAGYTPKAVKLKKPVPVTLKGESASKSITFIKGEAAKKAEPAPRRTEPAPRRTPAPVTPGDASVDYVPENPEDIVSDRAVAARDSLRWGRVIHYGSGVVVMVRRDGKIRKVTNEQLGLFGLESYRT